MLKKIPCFPALYNNQYPCLETSVRTAKTFSIHFVHFSLALKPLSLKLGPAPRVCFRPERTRCFSLSLSNPLQIKVRLKQSKCNRQNIKMCTTMEFTILETWDPVEPHMIGAKSLPRKEQKSMCMSCNNIPQDTCSPIHFTAGLFTDFQPI